jgi:hypothetical protein
MTSLLGGIVVNGVETLRKEIAVIQEILRMKNERLHEMESFLIQLQGRPSSMSYETEVLETSIVTIATVNSPTTGDSILSKMKDKEVLKIFYRSKVIAAGNLHFDAKEKNGYYILDKGDKKKYTTFNKWSFAKKKEDNPKQWADKTTDYGKRSVNCFRDGKWIKLSDLS